MNGLFTDGDLASPLPGASPASVRARHGRFAVGDRVTLPVSRWKEVGTVIVAGPDGNTVMVKWDNTSDGLWMSTRHLAHVERAIAGSTENSGEAKTC